jgi:GntR family transcriptional regulator/MocR family aminotransferase
MLIRLSDDEGISLQCQLFEQMRGLILDGTLKSGERLPASRALSETLAVSRNTIILAYARLADEGYIEMRGSVGTFVSSQIPDVTLRTDRSPQEVIGARAASPAMPLPRTSPRAQTLLNPHRRRLIADFWVGRPDARSFPIKIWTKLIHARLLSAGTALTEYKDPAGLRELRQAIVDHLRPARGIKATAEQVIIVGGCQDGLNLISRMLVSHATTAVLEDPCYQGAAYLFESLGARIHPIAVDAKGIMTERLPDERCCIAYVTPSHQYPLGVTLSLDRRLELIRWAATTDSYVLEDDYDSDFRFNGPPIAALKGLDGPERIIYLGTFSKCLGAGLRIGYVLVPPALVQLAQQTKTLMSNGQPWLEQATLADFMQTGAYERHLRKIRRLYLARRNTLLTSLARHFGESDILGSEAGMHVVWRLPKRLPVASAVQSIALEAGVGVYAVGSGGAVELGTAGCSDRYLVLGFSSLTEREIELGIERLAAVLAPRSVSLKFPTEAVG